MAWSKNRVKGLMDKRWKEFAITMLVFVVIVSFIHIQRNISDFRDKPKSRFEIGEIDSDNDMLSDFEEIVIYGTDPTSSDSDGDSFSDYYEIKRSHNPLDPDDHPLYFSMIALLILISISVIILTTIRASIAIENYNEKKVIDYRKQMAIMKHNEIRLFKLLHLIRTRRYSFRQLAKILQIRPEIVTAIFQLWVVKKCVSRLGYINLKKKIFVKDNSNYDYSKNRYCYHCGMKARKNDLLCRRCDNEIETCYTCNNAIGYSDPVGVCPVCQEKFHLEHVMEHLIDEEYCPKCLYELNLKEIGTIIPFHHAKK